MEMISSSVSRCHGDGQQQCIVAMEMIVIAMAWHVVVVAMAAMCCCDGGVGSVNKKHGVDDHRDPLSIKVPTVVWLVATSCSCYQ
jgi:hypothetical protein